jgi:hypothetical protein
LDLFVNNERILLKMHELLFGGTTNNARSQSLRSPNDQITLFNQIKSIKIDVSQELFD